MNKILGRGHRVAVVGATGMVGRKMLEIMEERNMPVEHISLFASKRSAGSLIRFCEAEHIVEELNSDSFAEFSFDIVFFAAGGEISRLYAPIAARNGAVVIDNSSFWRQDPRVPLIVPEVNLSTLPQYKKRGIIANPNCSTMQAMPVLKPLHDAFILKRVVYSTYQAVSGAGQSGMDDLTRCINGEPPKKFQHSIAFNCIPHIDSFLETGYTKEEQKMIDETRKILGIPELPVTATTVRVPVYNGHCLSVNIEFERDFDIVELSLMLEEAPGVVVLDDTQNNVYPMPITASGRDEVFAGRIRRDFSVKSGVNLFIAADNVRKGAATNAVQIAEELMLYWEREANDKQ